MVYYVASYHVHVVTDALMSQCTYRSDKARKIKTTARSTSDSRLPHSQAIFLSIKKQKSESLLALDFSIHVREGLGTWLR